MEISVGVVLVDAVFATFFKCIWLVNADVFVSIATLASLCKLRFSIVSTQYLSGYYKNNHSPQVEKPYWYVFI